MINILKKVKNIFTKKSKEIVIQKKSENKVYWTENGKNYHTDKNCISLLRSKNIVEGSLNECPKDTHCSNCK